MAPSIASYIDHAVLHPTQTDEDLAVAAALCAKYGVASICVKPSMVARAAELLAESPVKVSTVIGFPHGGCATPVKAFEAEEERLGVGLADDDVLAAHDVGMAP